MPEILMGKYRIFLNGKELDDFRYSMIQSVKFEDNATGSDLLSISLEDPEFLFLNDNIFVEDVKVKFMGGYDNDMRTLFEGYIAVIGINFPETGSPTMVINCMDNTHLMNRVKKSRTWNNTTRGKVARQIFQEYGLKAVIEDSGIKEETISQGKETDIEFLIKLSGEEIDHFLVYVEGHTGFYVRKKILASPQATLDYRDGNMKIISFSPTINKETKQVEARKAEVNLLSHKVDKAQANDNTPRNVQGTEVSSTDRSNGQSSWKSSSAWTKTY